MAIHSTPQELRSALAALTALAALLAAADHQRLRSHGGLTPQDLASLMRLIAARLAEGMEAAERQRPLG